jgi:dTMP kinase
MSPTPSIRRGRFVVLEGLDGAGTTTQAKALATALEEDGLKVFRTFEPSDGPVGVLLRQALTGRVGLPHGEGPLSPETLALLFAADRVDHIHAQVLPALARGEWVLCDRYVLSSLAYQGSSVPMAWVDALNTRALKPDLTLFLEVDVRTAAKRRSVRGGLKEIFDDDAAQSRIAKQYLAAIRMRLNHERIVRIDGTASMAEVTRRSLEEIRQLLPRVAKRSTGRRGR